MGLMFPAWLTILMVAAAMVGTYSYMRMCFEKEANGIRVTFEYLARLLDQANARLVELGVDPLDTEVAPEEFSNIDKV